MNKKLLQKTLKYYFIYAVAILFMVGPAFYLVSDILYEDDANEDLYAIKKQFDKFTKEDKTSYAFRLVFQANGRTLTEEEINSVMNPIYDILKSQEGFEIR